ncbi:hypothetical protein PV04_03962 [Phialophora macrospora]|uniref:Uncharacterized protein n=1 Tax=Phialophora macrospora TaxID=1851006 RepID=A0A0D2CS79_9EURO|nr:hypothetical protein PV04_03962 [Phialophora macrospora]
MPSQSPPTAPTAPRTGLQTGVDVLNLEQLKFSDKYSLSWYTDNLGAVIPVKYPPNRKYIRNPFHKVLDRATRYHNDTRPPGVEEVTIYERPAFRTTCRQLASLIPAEYFPPEGDNMVRFLEGVTGYTREKAGMNRYSGPRTKHSYYINPTLTAEAPHPARPGTLETRPLIKEEPNTDSTAIAGIAGYSEESAINLDPDDAVETILPLVESPQHTKQTKSKGPAKKSKPSSSSKRRNEGTESEITENEVIETDDGAQAPEVLSPQKSKRSSPKKRKPSQEDAIGVDNAHLINAVTAVKAGESSASKGSSKKRKKSKEAVDGVDNTQRAEVVTPEKSKESSVSKNRSKKLQASEGAAESDSSRLTKLSSLKKRKRSSNEVAESADDAPRTEFASAQPIKPSTTKKRKLLEEPAGIQGPSDPNEHISPKKSNKSKKSKSKQKKKNSPVKSHTESEHAAPVPTLPQAKNSVESHKIHAPAESSSPLLRVERKRKFLLRPEASPSKGDSPNFNTESSPPRDEEGTTAMQTAVNRNNSADEDGHGTGSSDQDEDETSPVTVRRYADKLLIERLMADNQALLKKHEEEIAVTKQTEKEERRRLMEGSKAEAEKYRREIATLRSEIAKLTGRKQSLEKLLYKGAGISPPDLETTLVRVEEGICPYRRSFQIVHKCDENKAKAEPKGGKHTKHSASNINHVKEARTIETSEPLRSDHGACPVC